MFNIGIGELVFIAVLILIFIGPDRLPKIMRQVGAFTYQIRQILAEINREFADELRPFHEMRGLAEDLNPSRQIGALLGTEAALDKKDQTSKQADTGKGTTASSNPMTQISQVQSGDRPVTSNTIAPPEAMQSVAMATHPMSQISQAKKGTTTPQAQPDPSAESTSNVDTSISPMAQI